MSFNLVENAMKCSKESGKVWGGQLEKVVLEKNYLRLCVKDTGIGIGENGQKRIFEHFCRIDKSSSKDTQGELMTGTGLCRSIVRHGAKYHNAKISVKSKLGEYIEFCLMFPL